MDTRRLEPLVGRTDEVRAFEAFVKSENAQQVIAYWGVAGQGKSMLLRHLASMCSGGEIARMIDLADIVPRYPSVATGKHDYASELLFRVADGLLAGGNVSAAFARRRYRRSLEKADSLLAGSPAYVNMEAKYGSSIIDSKIYVDSRFEESALLRTRYRQRQIESLMKVARASKRRNIILLIDTSEWLWLLDGVEKTDQGGLPVGWWFTHQVLPALLQGSGVKIVLGGREKLVLPDTINYVDMELVSWTPADTAKFLRIMGISYPEAGQLIHDLCKGVPAWTAMVTDLFDGDLRSDGASRLEQLAGLARGRPAEEWFPDILLRRVEPELKTPLLYASVLQDVSAEAVQVVARGESMPQDWFEKLLHYSFVQRHRQTSGRSEVRIHDLVRTAVHEYLRVNQPNTLKKINEGAAEYYQSRADENRYEFHAIAIGEEQALFDFGDKLMNALNEGRFDECAVLARVAIMQIWPVGASAAQVHLLAAAHLANGLMFSAQQRSQQAEWQLSKASRYYMDCKDLSGQSSVLRARAHLSGRQDNRGLAVKLAREAVSLARRCNDKKAQAESLVELGQQLHLQQGAARQATQHLQAAVSLFSDIGDIRGQARALLWLGEQARVAHRGRQATELLAQAKEKFEECNDKIGAAIVLSQLGEFLVQHGDPDGGRKLLLEALVLFESDDSFAGIHGAGNVFRSLAQSKVLRDEKDAEEDLERALELFRKISDKQGIAHTIRLFGQLSMRRRDDASAMKYFLEAEYLYQQVSDKIGTAHVKMFIGEIDLRRGAVGKGVKSVSEAYDIYRQLGDPLGEGNTLHVLGDVALHKGDLVGASERLAAALRKHEAAGDVVATAHDKISLAELAVARGNLTLARSHITAANEIYQAQHHKAGLDRVSRVQRKIESAS